MVPGRDEPTAVPVWWQMHPGTVLEVLRDRDTDLRVVELPNCAKNPFD